MFGEIVAMSSKARNRILLIAVVVALLAYVGSYLSRSLHGRYEPEMISNGVYYGWAPEGFVHEYKWNRSLEHLYYPLYYLDRRLWHTWGESFSGRYPINQVADADMGKLIRAWK